jgi:hypothetical protein
MKEQKKQEKSCKISIKPTRRIRSPDFDFNNVEYKYSIVLTTTHMVKIGKVRRTSWDNWIFFSKSVKSGVLQLIKENANFLPQNSWHQFHIFFLIKH